MSCECRTPSLGSPRRRSRTGSSCAGVEDGRAPYDEGVAYLSKAVSHLGFAHRRVAPAPGRGSQHAIALGTPVCGARDDDVVDVLEMLGKSTAWASAKVRGTDPTQRRRPTPCAQWVVGQLLQHILGGARLYRVIADGGYTDAAREEIRRETLDDDPAAAYDAARARLIGAFSTPGVLERKLKSHHGEQPGAALCALIACDQLIHGWDLAVSTGQDAQMPTDLIAPAFNLYQNVLSERGERFEPELRTASDADRQDALLAYCGRSASTWQ